MEISWPPMVADALAGGLAGALGWAKRAVAATSRPAQTKRRFMMLILLRIEPLLKADGPRRDDCRTGGRRSGRDSEHPVMMRRKALHAAETQSSIGWWEISRGSA